MKLEFGYGSGVQAVEIPDHNVLDVLVSNPVAHVHTGTEAVRAALDVPIGTPRLRGLAKPGQKIVIITSDISRPLPSYEILPEVLEELHQAGCRNEDICVVFGLGSHRKQSEAERRHLAGEAVYAQIRCVDSDPEDCVPMGVTPRGTPVDITRIVAQADFRICLGNVEFHYFAGYSGGAKALMPGVSTPAAIQVNHKLMVLPDARAGKLEGNPLREDIEQAEKLCPIHFLVNVVLDEHKKIIFAAAGDVTKAHRTACAYLDKMYRKSIPRKADIVIVSQGGAPKDANLYQTQKALDNAKHAVKEGGRIILIGACQEGLGSKTFAQWLTSAPTAHTMVERIGREFELGGHKAAAIAMVLEYARIDLVSEMDPDFVRSIFLNPRSSAQDALNEALKQYGPDATVLAMPYGGATLPVLEIQDH